MEKNKMKRIQKQEFVMPQVEIIVFEQDDVIATSGGGFMGNWDVDLPEIDF